ncbi:MAG TPA: PLP-dependent aminotransferase family protein [Vicinamibacterales bacterium]|nr:PLP-dependent aminotransferase family protein [Vicinamibacterales bacterium]
MINYERFLSPAGRQLQESAIRRMGTVVANKADLVSFAPGYPDATLFPWDELRAITAELLSGRDSGTLQYGPTRGYRPLLESILAILDERGIRATIDEVMITSGSQQAIDLTARLLVSPGDVVLVELPTFTGGIAAFRNAQADVVGVTQLNDGIDLDVLDDVWQRETRAGKRVKLLYLIPNFQNPTGVLLAVGKRKRLIEWAERRDVLILEDDPYGSLYFEDVATEAETRPIRSDDSHGRVFYLSTFSKTLAPGFRVGWVVAPPPLIDRLETAKQSVDLTSGILDQRIAYAAVQRGLIERLAPALRARYRLKRDVMERAIRREIGNRLSWQTPKGGFFIWANLPAGCTDTELLARALEQQVVFVVGSAFHVDGSGHDTIRLSFAEPPPERIEEGIRRLAGVLAPALSGRP